MKKKILFRADGNSEIGYGHFIRSLGLASLINNDFDCIFATQAPTKYQQEEIEKVCSGQIILSANENHFGEFLEYVTKDTIVVLDNYYFTSDYQLKIKAKGCKVIFIDDHNDKYYVCDVLINNIPGFSRESFKRESYTKLCLGIDYALLRPAFLNENLREIKKKNKAIFISFGGADIYNISDKIIGFLQAIESDYEINLLIGDAYKYENELKKYNNLNIYKNINAEEVAFLMASSSICIVPASSLLNEVASIGSRVLVGYFAENQIQPYEYFVNNDLAIGLGDYRNLNYKLFKDSFEKVLASNFLIRNQNKLYDFQQINNLKKIFYELQ